MLFNHNLSHRLALRRDALVSAVLIVALASCEHPALTGSSVIQVIVTPASVALDPGGQTAFAAYGRTATGDSAAAVVSWTASGGAITGTGVYTAPALPGDYLVTAISAAWNKSGSALAHVRSPAPVASVTVSPASASLTVGQAVQLTATPKDANGNPLTGRVMSWASGNPAVATVNGGLVTGVAAGLVNISATSEGVSGTAAITVR